MKLLRLFTLFFLPIYFISCNSDDDDNISQIQPSTSLIQMEGEGGSIEVSFTSGDWRITGVTNTNGDVGISGDRYSVDDELTRENYKLSLEGLGRMEAFGGSKGFVITRNTPTSLNIELKENSSGVDFNFTIDLQSGDESKKIIVEQKKSQGYNFKSIEYALKENDGDSLFIRNGAGYKFSIPSPQEFSFSPFNGIEINRKTYFKSNEKDAFVWLKNDSVRVKVPSSIDNANIYITEQKEVYTNLTTKFDHGFEQTETVTIPSGQSEFYTQIQFHKRTVSYTLYLTNKRTGEEKTIEGKWVEIAPTGKYDIKWKN
ncbi:hypothetical protein [Saccharicrinis fermentans]|uniref:Uncharacterized protein n=1 Tax=Saccharicrinis fermentans DSM 9555 = JCM 21142 TaxID=869213 RepID=W7Y3Y0_9BACT|nr:hypothetical protein [Saccharicrinis fermentans]GAF02293.1 hypothetical protein JCM21142_3923 [Saccharicrinis fermentans DSM 9555 = JCM 21142]